MDRYPSHGTRPDYGYSQPPPPNQSQRQDYPRREYPRDSWSSGPSYGPDSGQNRPSASSAIRLDDYNSDLNFVVDGDGVTGGSHTGPGFDHMWAGVRATRGVKTGKVCFEVTVLDKLPVNLPETETTPHVVRVGWSVDAASLQVGEDHLSYGYGATAKCSVNNKFFDYGERYSSNDVITCYVDLDATPKCMFFARNGLFLGVAFRLGPEASNAAFFPHVTVKNMRVRVNFGSQTPYFPPVQGFRMIQDIEPYNLVPGTAAPATQNECQVIMMVGLPGCGKTTWAEKYIREHPEKKFCLLGTNAIMDRMKVMGLMRKRNYHGRWDALIKQATDILNKVLKIAERKNRNYILDQTNVYPNARRRKMNNFRGFYRIAAVLVNTNEVMKQRTVKREKEEGKIVPEEAIMEMKSNFTLPEVGEVFNDIWFLEESKESSQKLVSEFQSEGKTFKDAGKKRTGDEQGGPQRGGDSTKRQRVDQGPLHNVSQSVDYSHSSIRPDNHGRQGYHTPSKPQEHSAGSYGGYHPRAASGPDRHGPPDRAPNLYGPPRDNRHGTPDRAPNSYEAHDRYGSHNVAPDRHGPSASAPDRYGAHSSAPSYGQSYNVPGSGQQTSSGYGYSAPGSSQDKSLSAWQGAAIRESYGTGGTHRYGAPGNSSQDTYQQGYNNSGYGIPPQDFSGSQDYAKLTAQGYGSQGYGYSATSYNTNQQQQQPHGTSGGNYASYNSSGYRY